jgi:hypothetical protein
MFVHMAGVAKRKQIRSNQRARRRERAARLQRLVPVLREFCERHGVQIRELEGSFQLRRGEYILTWTPSTNKITVQYKGTDYCHPFQGQAEDGKAKILVALERLIGVLEPDSAVSVEGGIS